jgi:hypothetical protein
MDEGLNGRVSLTWSMPTSGETVTDWQCLVASSGIALHGNMNPTIDPAREDRL